MRYHRNEDNIGAAPNFNLSVSLARGEFFKWAAHDDICAPEFLERCVEILDRDKEVVLAYPKSEVIDADSKPIDRYSNSELTHSEDPVIRFGNLIKPHICFQVFGLMRTADLKKTPMIGSFARGDEILLCWLGLRGRFFQVNEYLFFPRRHEEQSMNMLSNKKRNKKADFIAYSIWFDPKWKNRIVLPWWISLWELIRCIAKSPLSLANRFRCSLHVFRWVGTRRGWLFRDLTFQLKRLLQSDYETRGHSQL